MMYLNNILRLFTHASIVVLLATFTPFAHSAGQGYIGPLVDPKALTVREIPSSQETATIYYWKSGTNVAALAIVFQEIIGFDLAYNGIPDLKDDETQTRVKQLTEKDAQTIGPQLNMNGSIGNIRLQRFTLDGKAKCVFFRHFGNNNTVGAVDAFRGKLLPMGKRKVWGMYCAKPGDAVSDADLHAPW